MALNKPPINTTADTIAVKGWFNDLYNYTKSGILVPGGGSFSTPSYPGRRNLLVNGDFMINQRVPTSNTIIASTAAGTQWTLDRWAITNPPGVQWVVQSPMSALPIRQLGSQYAVTIAKATGNTSTATMYLAQAIESAKVQEIAGLPVTLSFWATGTAGFNSTYWQNQTFNGATGLVLAIMQTGTGVNEGTLAAYTGSVYLPSIGFTPNQYWQFYSITGVIPTTAKEMKVFFQLIPTAVPAPSSPTSFLRIAQVQLEVGTQPTAFDKISFDQSLLECQRFYEKSFDYGVTVAQNSGSLAGAATFVEANHVVSTNAGTWLDFKTRKIIDPAITFYCPKNASNRWWDIQTATVGGTSSSVNVGESGFFANELQISGEATGNQVAIHWDASADI